MNILRQLVPIFTLLCSVACAAEIRPVYSDSQTNRESRDASVASDANTGSLQADSSAPSPDDICRPAPTCCVGSTLSGCCRSTIPATIDFSTCRIDASHNIVCPASAGTLQVSNIGTRQGQIVDTDSTRVLVPGLSADYDNGVWLGDTLNITRGSATVTAAIAVGRCTDCNEAGVDVDGVAVGLHGENFSGASYTPIAALVVNASVNRVRFVVDGIVRGEQAIASTDATLMVSIRLDANGHVTMEAGNGARFQAETIAAAPKIQALIYGRTNRSRDRSGVLSATVTSSVCDLPQSLVLRDRDTLVAPGLVPAVNQIAPESGGRFAVFERDGKVYLATRNADGSFAVPSANIENGALLEALFAPSTGLGMYGVRDPYLFYDQGRQRWMLFFAALDAQAKAQLAFVTGLSSDTTPNFRNANVTAIDFGYSSIDGVLEIDGPSVFGLGDGAYVAYRTRTTADSQIRLARFTPGNFARAVPVELSRAGARSMSVVQSKHQQTNSTDFMRDEVSAPTVVVARRVVRIYFAARRGARWSIGYALAAEADLQTIVATGALPIVIGNALPVLSGTLGMQAPEAIVEVENDVHTLRLFHVALGADGSSHARAADQVLPQ